MSEISSGAAGFVSYELLLSTVIYLMTRYANTPTRALHHAICTHLDNLQELTPTESSVLKKNLSQVHSQWEAMGPDCNKGSRNTVSKTLH